MLMLSSFDLQGTSSSSSGGNGRGGGGDISNWCGGEEFKGNDSVKHQLGDPCAYHGTLALALLVSVVIAAIDPLHLLCSDAF